MEFDIKRSNKAYINSNEHYIVTGNGIVYLRIVGAEGNFVVMTATAGEDYNGEVACPSMASLNEAALRTSKAFGLEPRINRDFHDREYVELCRCEYISDAFRASVRLFDLLEKCRSDRTTNELVEAYLSLAIDDSGEDIYLQKS